MNGQTEDFLEIQAIKQFQSVYQDHKGGSLVGSWQKSPLLRKLCHFVADMSEFAAKSVGGPGQQGWQWGRWPLSREEESACKLSSTGHSYICLTQRHTETALQQSPHMLYSDLPNLRQILLLTILAEDHQRNEF